MSAGRSVASGEINCGDFFNGLLVGAGHCDSERRRKSSHVGGRFPPFPKLDFCPFLAPLSGSGNDIQ
jgi:hypothetical protein